MSVLEDEKPKESRSEMVIFVAIWIFRSDYTKVVPVLDTFPRKSIQEVQLQMDYNKKNIKSNRFKNEYDETVILRSHPKTIVSNCLIQRKSLIFHIRYWESNFHQSEISVNFLFLENCLKIHCSATEKILFNEKHLAIQGKI